MDIYEHSSFVKDKQLPFHGRLSCLYIVANLSLTQFIRIRVMFWLVGLRLVISPINSFSRLTLET